MVLDDEKGRANKIPRIVRAPPEPPNGGFGWVVVFATFMQHVISLGLAYTLGVYYPSFQKDFGADTSTTAWVAAAHLALLFASGPVAGWLLHKIGTAAVSFLGSVIAGLGCIAASFSNSILLVILSVGVLSGIGTGFMFISAVTAVTRWFSTKRSLATGLAVCGAGFGVFGFAPLVRILIDVYGREGALLIEGGLVFHGCVFALLLRPVPPANKRTLSNRHDIPLKVYVGPHRNLDRLVNGQNGHIGQFTKEELNPLQEIPSQTAAPKVVSNDHVDIKSVMKNWIFWSFALSQFLTFFSASAPLVFLYNRCVRDLGIGAMEASYMISIMGIFNTVGRLAFGALGNVFPRSRLYLLGGAIMMYGGATAASVYGTSFLATAAYAAVFGTGYGCMFSLTTVVLVDFFGVTLFGTIYGNIGVFRGTACLIGPPLGGWIIAQTGANHSVLFLITGSLGVLGGFLLLLIPLVKVLTSSKSAVSGI